MVVVRESPHSKLSPSKSLVQWPPRSPYECLSPSGREKWQQRRQQAAERSPSPSPRRRPTSSSKALRDLAADAGEDVDEDNDRDEDEEALMMELREIEIKKKLKRLRDAKKGGAAESGSQTSSRADSIQASPAKPLRPAFSQPTVRRPDVEVPLSPIRDRVVPKDPVSPARARLGLTAPARAQDVSLKRARDGTQIGRSGSKRTNGRDTVPEAPRALSSFSQRLAKSQQEQQDQQTRNERIDRARNAGGGFGNLPKSSASTRKTPTEDQGRTRRRVGGDRIPSPTKSGATRTAGRTTGGSSEVPSARSSHPEPNDQPRPSARSQSRPRTPDNENRGHEMQVDDSDFNIATDNSQDGSGYDPFSGTHLSKRHIAHVDVARALEGSEIYTLPRLLKEVKAPDYDPPDCESDFIVFGILASKSSPYSQKQTHRTNDEGKPQDDAAAPRNKFMVLKLVDLKWEVDCFLFGSGFDQFWKLTEGTLLAIQNPAILPPKVNHHSGRFSLKLSSSEDRVMEIGVARDLGYCASKKKDGQQCESWVDKRRTEVCEFHLNLIIDRSRKDRMEVNGMWRGQGNADNQPNNRHKSRDRSQYKKRGPGTYSREHGQLFSVPSGLGKSAASILDAEDTNILNNLTADEASRKRIAAAQRERDLAKKLDSMGHSVGAEYLRAKSSSNNANGGSTTVARSQSTNAFFDKPSASELGLLSNKATDIRLSPAKDRKRHFGTAAVGSAGTTAMGWGGAKQYGLLDKQPKRLSSPEQGQTRLEVQPKRGAIRARSPKGGSLSPKKRARFALEKGIREPGRESLGTGTVPPRDHEEDDDSDLDIV